MAPKGQPDLQIVLMKVAVNPFFLDADSVAALHLLLRKGVLGAGVFQTADCLKTYEELSAKGVEFQVPAPRPFLRHRGRIQRQLRKLVQPDRAQESAAVNDCSLTTSDFQPSGYAARGGRLRGEACG